jgi:hypothetical protein
LVKNVTVDHEMYQWYGFEPEDLFEQKEKPIESKPKTAKQAKDNILSKTNKRKKK